MPNRLVSSSSPYLRQHADNPIDWYPWGDEAFAKAAAEDKPVLLSVGYSACHWCHVMAHESFEDSEVAGLLNAHFVSVKVDREELPNVDEAYMTAVQLSSGRGGWPMTLFLTPDRNPFFAGTYFPKEDRGEHPGFLSIVKGIAEGWKNSRTEFVEAANEFAGALRETVGRSLPPIGAQAADFMRNAVGALAHDYDSHFGGFGGQPKFPPHTAIEFLLNVGTNEILSEEERRHALGMADGTLLAMAAGGIRDHVGGGFHRYSTDGHWGLPHFEKMLVDNALMLANYSIASRVLGRPEYQEVADEIVEWVEREMTAPSGLFYTALDADSEGEEGLFYVWKWDDVKALLGPRALPFMEAYGFAMNGNFEDEATGQRTGANIPMLELRSDGIGQAEFRQDLSRLLLARGDRPRPGLDDKILVGMNGLTIAGLAISGRVDLASRAATALVELTPAGVVSRQVVDGVASGHGYLEDYAGLAFGLTILAEVDPEGPWSTHARLIVEQMLDKFYLDGSFYGTSSEHDPLFGRTRPVFDQPAPSGSALACRALMRLGDLETSRAVLRGLSGWMQRAPTATEALHVALLELGALGSESVEVSVLWDGPLAGEVVVRIPEGWHLNTLRVEAPGGIQVSYPGVLSGELRVPFTLKEAGDILVTWQDCSDSECLAVQHAKFSRD